MEFTIKQSELKAALAAVQGCVVKSTIPILSCLLIESVGENCIRITGTDLDITIRRDAEAEVARAGAIVINAARLVNAARMLPDGDVHFKKDANGFIRVTCGGSKLRFPGFVREQYPNIEQFKSTPTKIPLLVLQDLLRRTSYAASKDASRYILNVVKLELKDSILRLVATDGYRIPVNEIPVDVKDDLDILIPIKAAVELTKIDSEEIAIGEDKNHIFFAWPGHLMIARKLAGSFPNYRMVIPGDLERVAVFDRSELRSALQRAGLMADEFLQTVKLQLAAGRLEITSKTGEKGEAEESVAAQYDGEEVTFGFRWNHFAEFLGNVPDGKRVTFSFKDESTNVILGIEGEEGCSYVLVPMKIEIAEKSQARREAVAAEKRAA
jgi:DNA polymerase-3 subunit beta